MFLNILTKGHKDTTYKFALARFLLEYSKNINLNELNEHIKNNSAYVINYEEIASAFLKYYWSQELRYKLKQNFHNRKTPKMVTILRKIFGEVYIPESFDGYSKEPDNFNNIEMAKQAILKGIFGTKSSKSSFVIPTFQDIKIGRDKIQNRIFYEFDDHAKQITVNPNAMKFFNNNNAFLLKTTFYEWAGFLEKINTIPRLIAKIEKGEEVRHSLKSYQKLLINTKHCFYCNKELDPYKTDVDHFIPWSYIFGNNLWNLVLSCRSCNCKKSNSLVDECYYKELIKRNSCLYPVLKSMRESLHELDAGSGWSIPIRNYYDNCAKHGFPIISTLQLQNLINRSK